jgi:protein phosphatase
LAVQQIHQAVANSNASQPLTILQAALEQANQTIYARSLIDPGLSGMGTTCVCAWIIADRLYTVSVGDSRLYLVRAGKVTQLTTDHTWVQEALDSGLLTQEQARNHPNAHVIRRHLGSQQPVVPDFRLRMNASETNSQAQANQGLRLQPGDTVVLCSDGLTDLVGDDEIGAAITRFSLAEALQDLVDQANERGGHDNISIVAIQVPGLGINQAPQLRKKRRWLWGGLFALFALAIGFFSTSQYWLFMPPRPTPTLLPSQAPLVVPSLIPTGTPLQATPTLTPTAIAPESNPSTPSPKEENPPLGPATYTPWPTSTIQGAGARYSP